MLEGSSQGGKNFFEGIFNIREPDGSKAKKPGKNCLKTMGRNIGREQMEGTPSILGRDLYQAGSRGKGQESLGDRP